MTLELDRVRLRDGVDPAAAAQVLDDRIHEAQRVNARDHLVMRAEYLMWVEGTEGQLAWMTHDAEILTMLQTPRYHQIYEIGLAIEPMLVSREGRPWPLIRAELEFQRVYSRSLPGGPVQPDRPSIPDRRSCHRAGHERAPALSTASASHLV